MPSNRPKTVRYPNRETPQARFTRICVAGLLVGSAVLIATVTLASWHEFQGFQSFQVFWAVIYVLLAALVMRWSRGALAGSTLASALLVMALIVGVESWFTMNRSGFSHGAFPDEVVGFGAILLLTMQIVLLIFTVRGFSQQWNIEEHAPAGEDG